MGKSTFEAPVDDVLGFLLEALGEREIFATEIDHLSKEIDFHYREAWGGYVQAKLSLFPLESNLTKVSVTGARHDSSHNLIGAVDEGFDLIRLLLSSVAVKVAGLRVERLQTLIDLRQSPKLVDCVCGSTVEVLTPICMACGSSQALATSKLPLAE